jgi:MFS family permease
MEEAIRGAETAIGLSQAPANERRGLLKAWVTVAVLMLLLTSSFIDRTILGLLVKPIRADLHISDTQFSYLTGLAFVVLYTTAGIPLGWVAYRWSRRALITIGVTVWSFATAACGMVGGYWPLFAARVGVGVGESTLSPCSYSLISDIFPPARLARAMSVFAMGIPIGSGLAMIIGGSVIEAITALGPLDLPVVGVTRPWQSVFLIIGLPGVLLAALAALVVREPPHRKARTETQPSFAAVIAYMWRHRSVYATLALSLGCFAAFSYGGTAWFPTFLMRVHGLSAGQAGLFIGTSTLVLGVTGSIAAGAVADRLTRLGRRDGLMLVGIAYAVGLFVCAAVGPVVPIRWLSLALFAGTGFFSLTWAGVNISTLQTVTPPAMRGQVSAIYLFTTNTIGLGLGPTAIAAATDHIFHADRAINQSLFLVGTVALALGSLILWLGRKAIARRLDLAASAQ